VYRRRDVELAVLLRRLLHEEGLTIVGAKRRLRETGQHKVTSPTVPSVAREVSARAELLSMREQLSGLLSGLQSILDGVETSQTLPDLHATVTASVPNSVPVHTAHAARRPPAS
jgi:hypothetical protein